MYCDTKKVEKLLEEFAKTRSAESWKKFYKPKIVKFFFEFLENKENNKPFTSINSFDIDQFLSTFENCTMKKLNYYYAIDAFFDYTYNKNYTVDVMKDVEKPIVIRKPQKYIPDIDVKKIKEYIGDEKNKLSDRLLLALMLYTGLTRKNIYNLYNYQLSRDESNNNEYYLWVVYKDERRQLPLNNKLRELIEVYYKQSDGSNDPFSKVFDYNETYISSKTTDLSEEITGKKYSPQIYSNTFIRLALKQDLDVFSVSQLTLKSLVMIEKHITTYDKLIDKQQSIVDSI
ncbi:MAG: site-specific integrase [Eubacteriales bacterium]|nr:site-specific integrase [Eubacteriales bacterium]